MRSLVAVVVALPWVVWALLRTLGVELSYPLVALIAFTPYAALTSPVPVVAALVLQAAGRGRGRGGGRAWRSASRWCRGRWPGRSRRRAGRGWW